MTKDLLDRIDLDDVLAKFSIYGRYHVVTGLCLTLGIAFNTMCYCSYVFIAEEIKYSCTDDKLLLNVNKSSNWSYIRNITSARCGDPNPCNEWIYENPHSFVAEFQLACQEWKRTLVGLVHIFGYTVGVIIVGSLSDRFGRKTLAISTGLTGAVCGLVKSFASFYWIYIVFEFLQAFLGDPYSPLYMLGLEMVGTKSRVTYMTTCSLGLVIGGMLFPLIKWLVPYWRTCLIVMHAPGLLFILLIYLVDESPRWLLTKGKVNIAVKNIKNAAKLNKIEIKENLNMIAKDQDLSEKITIMAVIADTFKSRALLKRFFVCVIWWNTCIFVSHGLTVTSVLLEGNKYVNFALVFLVRLPSSIIAQYVLNKFNRKGPLMSCFTACAVICITHPFIPKNITWLVITMFMTSQLLTGMSFTILYIFTSELFPTYTRNSMQALCSSLGRIGGLIATQIPLLRVYWTGLPIVLFGVMSLVAALATLLVPDTGKASLPDTVRQAEAIGVSEARTTQKDRDANRRLRKKRANFN